jgi:hypothetical protein
MTNLKGLFYQAEIIVRHEAGEKATSESQELE